MINMVKNVVTYSFVAKCYGVSKQYVINKLDEIDTSNIEISLEDSKNICIDEVKIAKVDYSSYQCVVYDFDKQMVIDILNNRQTKHLKEYFSFNSNNIKTVRQDLCRPYRTVVNAMISNAQIVADHFHVVRQFIWAFNRTRISIIKKLW